LGIDDWRKEIDDIDERLVELLNRRSQCAIEIGRLKRAEGLPIYSPEREAEVIDHALGRNGGPLEPEAVRRLFERIIDESRRIERITVVKEEEGSRSSAQAKTRSSVRRKEGND
jgi:chorismate mutase